MSVSRNFVRIACILALVVCVVLLVSPGASSQQPRPRTPVRTLPPRPQPAPFVANTQQRAFVNRTNTANQGFVVASQPGPARPLVFPATTGLYSGVGLGAAGLPGMYGGLPVGFNGLPQGTIGMTFVPGVGMVPVGINAGYGLGVVGPGVKGFGFNGGNGLY
jgi:hypothetical protein